MSGIRYRLVGESTEKARANYVAVQIICRRVSRGDEGRQEHSERQSHS